MKNKNNNKRDPLKIILQCIQILNRNGG